jgi:hypothetical protein
VAVPVTCAGRTDPPMSSPALAPDCPICQEGAAVRNALPRALDLGQGRGSELKNAEGSSVALRLRQLDNLDRAAGTVRLSRNTVIGSSWRGKLRLRQEAGAFPMGEVIVHLPKGRAMTAAHRAGCRRILRRLRVRTFFAGLISPFRPSGQNRRIHGR